jgi:predicted 3-demethylubiquinone-9 3-methyltransferase (glyoxalase superfamily)
MQKITPFFWFPGNAEEAVRLYTSIFDDAKTGQIAHYDDAGAEASGMPKGSVLTIAFSLAGQDFVALNGGPNFEFTPAISFYVNCATQAEVDHYWQKLTENGGEPGPCGWLKDKFGVSWQIVPSILPEYLNDPNAEKAGRVMQAMLQMQKIDIAALEAAYQS